jgi:O-antigen/teichoic acid export membrane protein
MNNKLTRNVFYSFLLQFTTLFFPLITIPYLSRVLGSALIGKVNFANSVVEWFIIFSTFGLLTYGVREVARIQQEPKKLSKFYSEILLLRIILTLIVSLVYLVSIHFIHRFQSDLTLFRLYGLLILFNIFSLDWFFQGVEDYKYITLRSIILKILSVIAIFVLIKQESHYMIYAGILIATLSIGHLLNFIHARKYVKVQLTDLKPLVHLKKMKFFFLTTLIVSIYTLLDQVFLGFIKGDVDVALYQRAKMFFYIGMSISVSINNAITPRINGYFMMDKEKYKSLLMNSLVTLIAIAIPIMLGVLALSKDLMVLFGGEEFEGASTALQIISPLLLIIPISIWNYQQRILPNNDEKIGYYINGMIALISIIMNVILVPSLGYVGTAFSWLIAESVGLIISLFYTQKKDSIKIVNLSNLNYFISGIVMFIVVLLTNQLLEMSWLNLGIQIIIGALTYFVTLILLRDKNVIMILTGVSDYVKKGESK